MSLFVETQAGLIHPFFIKSRREDLPRHSPLDAHVMTEQVAVEMVGEVWFSAPHLPQE